MDSLKDIIFNTVTGVLVGALIITMFTVLTAITPKRTDGNQVIYDCRIAEISPDFPPEVRNECRKRNATRK